MKPFQKTCITTLFVFCLSCLIAIPSCWAGTKNDQNAQQEVRIEKFAQIDGLLHGIAFDNQGHMFIGKNGKEILKVSPDGSYELHAIINEAQGYFIEGPGHTFLYDMAFDQSGQLYAACEDRILKISANGEIETLIKHDFTGFWGACSIALDKANSVYYAYDNKIMKLTTDKKSELFLDGSKTNPRMNAIVGIEFDENYEYIFACDGNLGSGKLVRVPVSKDAGQREKIQVLYENPKINIEYIAMDQNANLIVKGPWSTEFIRIDKQGTVQAYKHNEFGYGIQTIAMGAQGFDSNALYGTQMPNGPIYKITLP